MGTSNGVPEGWQSDRLPIRVVASIVGHLLRIAAPELVTGRLPRATRNLVVLTSAGLLASTLKPTAQWGRALLGDTRARITRRADQWVDWSGINRLKPMARFAARYFEAAYRFDPARAGRDLERLISADAMSSWSGSTFAAVAAAALAAGDEDHATRILGCRPNRRGGGGVSPAVARLLEWLPEGKFRTPVELLPGSDVAFGVIDYRQPGHESTNLGDYVQTIASLGHLLSLGGLEFCGDAALVDAVRRLGTGLRVERRVAAAKVMVQLVPVQRDASRLQSLPDPLWLLAFGWYMHPFHGRYSFPFHESIRPIFISFHLSHVNLLDEEGLEYLRMYGPVGCRDWQTAATLRAHDVPVFFSGCITTTVDTLFSGEAEGEGQMTLYVDSPPQDGGERVTQIDGRYLSQSLARNLLEAYARVDHIRTTAGRLVTSRLHAYLPARSVGVPVTFVPENPDDVRFSGLSHLSESQFDRMRQGISEKLGLVLPLVMGGAPGAEVYSLWREICANDVKATEERLGGILDEVRIASRGRRAGREADSVMAGVHHIVVLHVAAGGDAATALLSLDRNCPRGVGILLLGTKLPGKALPRLSSGRRVDFLDLTAPGQGPSPSSLLLELIDQKPELETLLFLDSSVRIRQDLGNLFDRDLGTTFLARRSVVEAGEQGVGHLRWLVEKSLLSEAHAVALELWFSGPSAVDLVAVSPRAWLLKGRLVGEDRDKIEFLVNGCGFALSEALNVVRGTPTVDESQAFCVDPLVEQANPGVLLYDFERFSHRKRR